MGYTTTFEGFFNLDRQLSPAHADALWELAGVDSRQYPQLRREGAPEGYCQWQPTRRLDGIEWDGNEKFYDYVQWLQFIIDKRLKPWGYTLSGSVHYAGEGRGDTGMIAIIDGRAIKQKAINLGRPEAFADAVAAAVVQGEPVRDAVLRLLTVRMAQGHE